MLEYLASNLWQVWAAIAVICLVLELSSGDFYITCFAIGAVAAAVVAPFADFYVQLAVWCVVAGASVFWLRPAILRHLHKGEDARVSGADALIGRTGRVSQAIEMDGYGRVAIDGDDWKAQSLDGKPIAKGEKVKVVNMESIIVTVDLA